MKVLMMAFAAAMIAAPAFADSGYEAQSSHAHHVHRSHDRGWRRNPPNSREDETCPGDVGYPGGEGRLRGGAGIPGPCLHK